MTLGSTQPLRQMSTRIISGGGGGGGGGGEKTAGGGDEEPCPLRGP